MRPTVMPPTSSSTTHSSTYDHSTIPLITSPTSDPAHSHSARNLASQAASPSGAPGAPLVPGAAVLRLSRAPQQLAEPLTRRATRPLSDPSGGRVPSPTPQSTTLTRWTPPSPLPLEH